MAFPMRASIEVTAKQALEKEAFPGLFPQGTRVYIADLGTSPVKDLVRAARDLSNNGYCAVPHFPARRIAGEQDLRERLTGFTREAGVTDALVIAGSVDRVAGPFLDSMALLNTGLFADFGIRSLAVAGHPEGNPDASDDAIMQALADKIAYADRTDTALTLATQFSFEADPVIAWAERLQNAGICVPLHVGVAGPAKITTLLKYAAICGVGQSFAFLKKRRGTLAALATKHSPEGMVSPLEDYAAKNPTALIDQIHVFPFGGVANAAAWLTERGSWFGTGGNFSSHGTEAQSS